MEGVVQPESKSFDVVLNSSICDPLLSYLMEERGWGRGKGGYQCSKSVFYGLLIYQLEPKNVKLPILDRFNFESGKKNKTEQGNACKNFNRLVLLFWF